MMPDHPVLVIIRGIPGSGKSFLATALAQAVGADASVVLDPDKIDTQSDQYKKFSANLTAENVDEKFHPFRYLRQRGFDGILTGKTIIWNQAFADLNGFQITVDRLQTFAKEHGIDLPLLLVEVEIDAQTARSRIDSRAAAGGHDVPADAFDGFTQNYKSFANHGYTVVTVNGKDDVAESTRRVIEKLREL